MSENKIVLYGAGACGRYAIKHLATKGIIPVALVDSDSSKWGTRVEGLKVMSPEDADREFAFAQWVACAISRPAATEIRQIIKGMGVRTKPLWECIPVHHGVPSDRVRETLAKIAGDADTILTVNDQCIFRKNPNYDTQCMLSPKEDIYFPDFITHLDDEHFVDCGAADGDTVKAFMERWNKWERVSAFEPDIENYKKLAASTGHLHLYNNAVGDCVENLYFSASGDYSSHVGVEGKQTVLCVTLDSLLRKDPLPTFIKADVEGYELELLWGARKIIKEHSPVLAICAYHQSSHLWDIPLLIHALNPEYKLFLRRYAEGAFELVWYAVPPERVK